jgi:hypothetical protein
VKSIVRVGDGDGLYGEQWNLSGDRRVLRDLNPRPQAVLFYRRIPSVFHQTLSKYTPMYNTVGTVPKSKPKLHVQHVVLVWTLELFRQCCTCSFGLDFETVPTVLYM